MLWLWHVAAYYEPKQCKAYSSDLRWRMVYQRQCHGLTYEAIGTNLGVDQSTVHRTVNLFLSTGNVEKKKYDPTAFARQTPAVSTHFAQAVIASSGSPSTPVASAVGPSVCPTTPGISPGKITDLRMKKLHEL